MLRQAVRSSPRLLAGAQSRIPPASRRFLSTSPAQRPRTWRASALRWGAAVAAVYWYNTSPIFADEPALQTIPAPPSFSENDRQTVDAVIEEKRQKAAASAAAREASKIQESLPSATRSADPTVATLPAGSPEALEEEAGQQGAFNPETGEINWDCPCLGGMADGPCGEEFKTAFSCFVFSKDEPKGMDCIDKFQGMQECFRKHPEIYGAELAEDDAEDAEPALDAIAAPPPKSPDHADDSTSIETTESRTGTDGSDEMTKMTSNDVLSKTAEPADREAVFVGATKSASIDKREAASNSQE